MWEKEGGTICVCVCVCVCVCLPHWGYLIARKQYEGMRSFELREGRFLKIGDRLRKGGVRVSMARCLLDVSSGPWRQ